MPVRRRVQLPGRERRVPQPREDRPDRAAEVALVPAELAAVLTVLPGFGEGHGDRALLRHGRRRDVRAEGQEVEALVARPVDEAAVPRVADEGLAGAQRVLGTLVLLEPPVAVEHEPDLL